jgi:hypothetical protein
VKSAVFIDLECRKNRPPTVLGVLGRDSSDFHQWILDPAVRTAEVARPHVRLGTLDSAAAGLAAQKTESIVGWSLFDLKTIVNSADVDEFTKTVLRERYVNAIEIAKRWRRTYLPNWKLAANELKAYFPATGFTPQLRRDIRTEPADWIKHLEDQIAARGHYKNVTQQAKRDWHRLLIYNEDDCRGLQHVFETATRELTVWEGYKSATVRVETTPDPIDVRVGWRPTKLDQLLASRRASHWAFITASNPASVALSAAENDKRHAALIREIERAGLRWLPGRGIGDGWSERSLLVIACSEAKALALGQRFGQLAVVVGRRGEPARLLSCRTLPV